VQPDEAGGAIPIEPGADRRPVNAEGPRDLVERHPVRRQQHDANPPD
jgi:hypothetical protein